MNRVGMTASAARWVLRRGCQTGKSLSVRPQPEVLWPATKRQTPGRWLSFELSALDGFSKNGVGRTGFEPVTSSVSGKRSPAELTARYASPRCYQSQLSSARRQHRVPAPRPSLSPTPGPQSADLIATNPTAVLAMGTRTRRPRRHSPVLARKAPGRKPPGRALRSFQAPRLPHSAWGPSRPASAAGRTWPCCCCRQSA